MWKWQILGPSRRNHRSRPSSAAVALGPSSFILRDSSLAGVRGKSASSMGGCLEGFGFRGMVHPP